MRRIQWLAVAILTLVGCWDKDPVAPVAAPADGSTNPGFSMVTASFNFTDLGTLGGFSGAGARAVNDDGAVVGFSYTPDDELHAFLWTPGGGMQDLGTPFVSSHARGINNSGAVVGSINHNSAFLWTQDGGMQDIGTLGGCCSIAYGINSGGAVVGGSEGASTPSLHAFLWTPPNGPMQDLGTFYPGFGGSIAFGINSSGAVVGASATRVGTSFATHAFLWTPPNGPMQDLGTLGGRDSQAFGINSSGAVVGSSNVAGDAATHAFLWTPDGGMQDLGTLGGTNSQANGINISGAIVGWSHVAGDGAVHAFLWTADGGMQDISATGSYNDIAFAINDAGHIVGISEADGLPRAALWQVAQNQPADQTIAFAALPDRTFGDAPFTVSATASSGLPVSFAATGNCSLAGNTVTITGAGSCSVTASQPGDAAYNAAPDVEQSFTIAKADQTVTLSPIADHFLDDAPFTVSATGGGSGQPVTFSSTGSCSVSGNTVTINTVGSCTITASQAGDANYNPAGASQAFNVFYRFTGFFQPIDNLPTLNSVNAGRAIPIKFSLGGDQGLAIFAAGYPKSVAISCRSSVPVAEVEQTVTAGSSTLTYDAVTNQYHYVWKTDNAWANQCRQLIVRLVDGTEQRADFKFK